MANQLVWFSPTLSFDAKFAQSVAMSSGCLLSATTSIASYHAGDPGLVMRVRGIRVPISRGEPPILTE